VSTADPTPVRRTVPRSQVVSVLLAVVLLTLAAVGYRLSDDDRDFSVVRGGYGEFAGLGSGTVRVDDVRVGTRLVAGSGDPIPTDGLFVVLRVTVRDAGRDALRLNNFRLLAEDTTYAPTGSLGAVAADPGFEGSGDVAFEVAPDRMTDLTLEAWSTQGFVVAYGERLRVHLGITAENEAAWRDAGQDRRVTADTTVVTRGMS
jgi:hypothetical protein